MRHYRNIEKEITRFRNRLRHRHAQLSPILVVAPPCFLWLVNQGHGFHPRPGHHGLFLYSCHSPSTLQLAQGSPLYPTCSVVTRYTVVMCHIHSHLITYMSEVDYNRTNGLTYVTLTCFRNICVRNHDPHPSPIHQAAAPTPNLSLHLCTKCLFDTLHSTM